MKKVIFFVWLLILPSSIVFPQGSKIDDVAEVNKVLVKSYIEGIHINRDVAAVKKGFHQDFVMHVYTDEGLIKAPLDRWLDRLRLDGKKNPITVAHQFGFVDITGNSAILKMEISEDKKHIYTDYFSLYKFKEGWRIVGKIFYSH